MTKAERPIHDPTMVWPVARSWYSAFITGRPGDGVRDEPAKLTQAVYSRMLQEELEDWVSRIAECVHVFRYFREGKLKDPEKVTPFLTYPPAFVAKTNLNPSATVMLFGNSVDVCFACHDDWTIEIHYFFNYHYENGMQTYGWTANYEIDPELLERRHPKVGEPVREICTSRPKHEGGMLVRDIQMDIRNEKSPEYARAAFHNFPYHQCFSTDQGIVDRSSISSMAELWHGFNVEKLGWPFETYGEDHVPRPAGLDLLLQNPPDIFTYRYHGLLYGEDWCSKHTVGPQETAHEFIGNEMIPPTPDESAHMTIRFGMDRYKWPESFKQSKYLYGQDAKVMPGDPYPLPETAVVPLKEAERIILRAREEHPEWLAGD